MARPKDRPGSKSLAGLPLLEKLLAYQRGSKVKPEAWELAFGEMRRMLKQINNHATEIRVGKLVLTGKDIQVGIGFFMNAWLRERADFYAQVARAFERMGTRHDIADWLLLVLRPEADTGRPLPTKAEVLRRLGRVPGLRLNGERPDMLKQLRRAERYLGIKLPKAPPGQPRKT